MAERDLRWQGVGRTRLDYVVQPVDDIPTIRSILAPRVEYTAYALGQLEPALFPRTRWFYARGTTTGCEALVTAHPESYLDYSTGVRCCADASG